ncbi:MAG: molecular chaperone DjlA, partial [Rhodobacteraceae bacterium CG2_30_10_405]
MSIWTRITAALAALATGEGLSVVFERLRTPPERSVGFTIAIIALGAKMAKADGRVTRDEVAAFRQIFAVPVAEEAAAARVFDLARQDVAGFDAYARKIKAMFDGQPKVLVDLLEGLFQIALADGHYHPAEDAFLAEVARIFAVGERCFRALRARFVPDAPRDPYDVLGLPHH